MATVDHSGKDPQPNPELIQRLTALEDHVNNLNKSPVIQLLGDGYKQREFDKVFTVPWHGWVFGYRLVEHKVSMEKRVFIKVRDGRLDEVAPDELREMMWAAITVFMETGSGEPDEQMVAPDCIMLRQMFIPCVLTELNKNIVTPGRVG